MKNVREVKVNLLVSLLFSQKSYYDINLLRRLPFCTLYCQAHYKNIKC